VDIKGFFNIESVAGAFNVGGFMSIAFSFRFCDGQKGAAEEAL
jgi:hypothetical protein